MKVLDLYSGLGGWAEPFRDRGHDVTTLDIDPAFDCDITVDIRKWKPDHKYHVVVASPPCEYLSTLTFQRGYFKTDRAGVPHAITEEGRLAIALVAKTWRIIKQIQPKFYVVENPRALLRKVMPQTRPLPHVRHTVWYCHYGMKVAKPTDLWGRFPPSFDPEPPCHNRYPSHTRRCCCTDHNAAPRGSRSGTQSGQTSAQAAKIPYELALAVCLAAEADIRKKVR